MQSIPGKFVWFEHVSNDLPRARDFYQRLFGWHVEAIPMGAQRYPLLMNGSDGIGGLRKADAGVQSHWLPYLSVADVDAAHARAVEAGAREQSAPSDLGAVGRLSVLADPDGAVFALWKGSQGDRPDLERTAVGDWVWNELWSVDTRLALAFYERAFGFRPETMDMGEHGLYHLLRQGERPRAGVCAVPEPHVPPMWVPYVHVVDCDAAVAKATALGARVPMPGADVPGVGRFAILNDPLGAAVAVLQPSG